MAKRSRDSKNEKKKAVVDADGVPTVNEAVPSDREARMKALNDLLGVRFTFAPEDFKLMMDEDVYDQ